MIETIQEKRERVERERARSDARRLRKEFWDAKARDSDGQFIGSGILWNSGRGYLL